MDNSKLIEALDCLEEIEADFYGWVCFHDDYNPECIGYDVTVELLKDVFGTIDEDRAQAILATKRLTETELTDLKAHFHAETEDTGGAAPSYWICTYPNEKVDAVLAMYQYEDCTREVAGIFASFEEAERYGDVAGFDLVGH